MANKNSQWWKEKLNRSSFFFIAIFLHVIILAMVATLVIFKPTILSTPDFGKTYLPPGGAPPPPLSTPVTVAVPTVTVPVTAPTIVSPNAAAKFTIPALDLGATVNPNVPNQVQAPKTSPSDNTPSERLSDIRTTVSKWRSADNILNSGDDVRNVVAKFPVYLAVYAGGDWYCNNYKDATGTVTAGCLPNLIHQIGVWSHGNLKGDVVKLIHINSPDLLSDPPPFIFFTGHRDFKLSEAEIENLQKYLQIGGAIWGDSAFAGDGSRFDVAFHREMKRVLPDTDKNFEALPMTHDIFTHSWFPIDQIPPGMNYRADPVEIINIEGRLAVIYTPNDYGDMMTMLLKTDVDPPQMDLGVFPQTRENPLYTPKKFLYSQDYFFRNYEPDGVQPCYKLSMNILSHLLIRFDKDLQQAP